jgi:hypothetical protein
LPAESKLQNAAAASHECEAIFRFEDKLTETPESKPKKGKAQ